MIGELRTRLAGLTARLAGLKGWLERDRVRRWIAAAKTGLFALLGATLAVALFGHVAARIGPFDSTVSLRPALSSETVVHLSPLGRIHLDTHDWPLSLQMRVDQLGLDEARAIAQDPESIERLGDDVADEVGSAFWRLALRGALLAIVGGILGALAARIHWRSLLTGAAVGVAVVVAMVTGTVTTFDSDAVSEPRYSGLLQMAPRAVGDVESVIDRYGEYRAQLSDLVGNVVTLYLAAEGLPTFAPTDSTIKVLHVSDLHLNVQAWDVMHNLVDQFGIDAIADTGDIVDWGTSAEDQFVEEIGDFDIPYVWVRGNHDSQGTQRAIEEIPNAVVLDDQVREVAGLRFWGAGDPRYTPDRSQQLDREAQAERAEELAPEAADMLADAAATEPVDVAMIHDPRMAEEFGGEAPLVLAGHTHQPEESRLGEEDESVLLVEGSTGGAGLRGLQDEEPTPLTATILYFDPGGKVLVAYDRVTVSGLGETGATIDRHVLVDQSSGEAEDPPDDGTS